MRILIFGSCVSRDILTEQGDTHGLTLVDYYARCSLASLGGQPLRERPDLSRIASAFQRRMVERDLDKTFLEALPGYDFEILLLDLIDERFAIHVDPSDGVCTLSAELRAGGFRPHAVVKSGTGEFWSRWEAGWTCLHSRLVTLGLARKLRLNAVRWSRTTEDGTGFMPHYSDNHIAAANALLERMYERIARDVPEEQFLRFAPSVFTGASDHRWGRSPFHYVPAYYREAAERLLALR